MECPEDCNENGNCVDFACKCEEEWTGESCKQKRCPNDCSGNGSCVDGVCTCNTKEYWGDDCSYISKLVSYTFSLSTLYSFLEIKSNSQHII